MTTTLNLNAKPAATTSQFLWRIVRFRPMMFGALIACYVVQYCLSMVPVIIARQIIDSLSGTAQASVSFETLFALWITSEIARAGLFSTIIIVEINYLHRFWALIRANLFERILERPGAQALPYSTGEAISRFRDDVDAIQEFMSAVYNAVAMGAFAAIAFVVMLSINVRMTLVVFVPMVFITALVNQARERIVAYRAASQAATGRITGALGEMFGAVSAIQAAQAEGRIIQRLTVLNRARQSAALRDSMFTEMLLSMIRNVTNFGTGIILLLGAESMRLGQFSVGDFVLFVFYLGWVTNFTAYLGQVMSAYRKVSVSQGRLNILMQGKAEALVKHRPVYFNTPLPEVPTLLPARTLETLDIVELSYTYPNSQQGIHRVSFQIERGQVVVITGRIGAGKTTLLRAILGLLPDVEGVVRWNGEDIADRAAFFVPPQAAYTPQVPHLFSDSLRDNILMGLPLGQEELTASIHAAALETDLMTMDDGLNTRIGTRGMRLSGGQALRTAAARMFIRSPELLVIDDLSSALDTETEHLLWERMRARPDTTCLIVSHRPAILSRADQVITLDAGHIQEIHRSGGTNSVK